jgi:hypothetical protein
LLNLRKTEGIEIAGEGETKYRFTFARFSAIDTQRHVFKREISRRFAAEQAGCTIQKLDDITRRISSGAAVTIEERATFDALINASSWSRIICSLVKIEVSADGIDWQDEEIPSEWSTPDGFLSSIEQDIVFLLDGKVLDLNRKLLGLSVSSEDDKKKEEENTKS